MALITKGGDEKKKIKNALTEKIKQENDQKLSLTVNDIENLLQLMQQVKLPVGQYPFKELDAMTSTLHKLRAIFEKLKQMEVLK